MVSLWMIGYGDVPERSSEICVCEIFGRDVGTDSAAVGVGVHPFGDPEIVDDFSQETVPIDAREFHTYAAEWTPERVRFFVDGEAVKTVDQSPGLSAAADARHLRVPGRADALSEGVRRRLRPRVRDVMRQAGLRPGRSATTF